MATSLTTISNVSRQVVPILVNAISSVDANANATIPAKESRQLLIPPGSQTVIETQRIDLAQLERLRNLMVLTFTTG